MSPSEETIEQLEAEFPKLFSIAIRGAHERAVASGARVLIEKDGALYEIANGRPPLFIRKTEPGTAMKKGRKVALS